MSQKKPMGTADVLRRLSNNPDFKAQWDLEAPKIVLATNVSRIRNEKGLTQQQLAEAAGMKQPRIAEIERGDANPQIETLTKIAIALGVTLADLHAGTRDSDADDYRTARTVVTVFKYEAAPRLRHWGNPVVVEVERQRATLNELYAFDA